MNIQRFIEARKAAGYSQSELAEGICTQATLSRFENNGQVPSLKILTQLCERMGLPIGELFPRVEPEQLPCDKLLDQGEFFLITSEYQQLTALLDQIDVAALVASDRIRRYYYLRGYSLIFQQAPITDILFTFDQLLKVEPEEPSSLYQLLGNTGIGMAYAHTGEVEKADFYFENVLEQVYDYPIKDLQETWRVLNILFHCGEFYGQQQEFATSDAILTQVVTICSDNHVTYYLARAAYQLAMNALAEGKDEERVRELLTDARAFAKVNRNQKLLTKIADYLSQS